MVKKNIIQRSIKKYKLQKMYKTTRVHLKCAIKAEQSILYKYKLTKKFQSLPKNSSYSRFNRFCTITGRNHGYYRNFGVSRHILREMAHNCELPGITKASW